MKATNNEVINQFIIDQSLVIPVSKIVTQLRNGDFRDCDIKWLDAKLSMYSDFACKTLGISAIMPNSIEGDKRTILNDYMKNKYINYFNTILEYFKSL